MIETIHIENYKSIHTLDVPLSRVTVLIGENGSGKSNILEAIAFAAAASQKKLDHEFLVSRGIRVNSPKFMKSAFNLASASKKIRLKLEDINKKEISFVIDADSQVYPDWRIEFPATSINFEEIFNKLNIQSNDEGEIKLDTDKLWAVIHAHSDIIKARSRSLNVSDFLIFSPENTALRTFEKEAQIEPLGINGEGLYKLLTVTAETEPEKIKIIKENLNLIGWFEDFNLPESRFGNLEIIVKDKFIEHVESEFYNHKNTNEGFLFLLFYILLFVSDKTPNFFAIDNIDASLNPKLCTELTKKIVQLAKEYDKQVILTTHNPAILDGLDLSDEEQKILVVSRNKKGQTKVRALKPPNVPEGEVPIKLSEAFLNGMIGGLPKNF